MIERIIERYFESRDGELLIGGLPIGELVETHGTPLFVYDAGVIARKAALLREALPAPFELYYSIKANPNQTILKHLVASGCGLEIASAGELHQAIACGCDPARILFAGPGKTVAELEAALAAGVGEIHVESEREIDDLARIAGDAGVRAHAAIRVNPAAEAQGGAMRMGGTASPFGLDEERLESALTRLLQHPTLEFSGIHLFVGTQILDAEILLRQYRKGIEIGKRAAAQAGAPLRTLDFGGGLGIPYFPNDAELDVDRLRRGLAELIEEHAPAPELSGTRFIVEPGRFLVGESGVYVTRVTDVKQSRGKTYLVLDGGMNHHLAASGNLGQVIKRNFPSAIISRLDGAADHKVQAVGPLCTPLDVLGRDVSFPNAEVGDLVGVFQSGAYARAASPLNFLSHATPAEVWVADGRARLVRKRGEPGDYLRDQCGE